MFSNKFTFEFLLIMFLNRLINSLTTNSSRKNFLKIPADQLQFKFHDQSILNQNHNHFINKTLSNCVDDKENFNTNSSSKSNSRCSSRSKRNLRFTNNLQNWINKQFFKFNQNNLLSYNNDLQGEQQQYFSYYSKVPYSNLNLNHKPYELNYFYPNLTIFNPLGASTSYKNALLVEKNDSLVRLSAFVPNFRLDIYHNLNEVYSYLDQLSIIKKLNLFTIGHSNENRPIKAIEINQDNLTNKLVYIDGLIHAREWITTATILNLIEQILLNNYKANFLIVPIINVDGYHYSWTVDRMWRKNRRQNQYKPNNLIDNLKYRISGEKCNGIDLNRNFDINFSGVGSSTNPCSELYAGPQAFSEPESAAIARLIWKNKNRIRLFLSLHSFNQLWASPHSYVRTKSVHHDLHMSVLKEVQEAVYRVNKKLYNVGPLGVSLYLGSGYSMDWAYEKARIVHSYLVELPDKGEYGFLLPENQILPVSFEVLEGLKVLIKRAY